MAVAGSCAAAGSVLVSDLDDNTVIPSLAETAFLALLT
jgi:hypothetical protein